MQFFHGQLNIWNRHLFVTSIHKYTFWCIAPTQKQASLQSKLSSWHSVNTEIYIHNQNQ